MACTECGSDLCLPRGGAEDEHVLADGLRVEVVQGDVRGLVQDHRVHRRPLLFIEQHLKNVKILNTEVPLEMHLPEL